MFDQSRFFQISNTAVYVYDSAPVYEQDSAPKPKKHSTARKKFIFSGYWADGGENSIKTIDIELDTTYYSH